VRAAVFFDRDGVVDELVPDPASGLPESPLAPEQVVLIAGAADALRRLRDAGYVLVGTSNQPAAAKGIVALEQLNDVQARVLDLLERAGAEPDAFRICFHHPAGVVPELTHACNCRKPSPGMLLDAAAELGLDLSESWMIGDTDADVETGAAAGCRTILIDNPDSAHKRGGTARTDTTAADLAAAADFIVVNSKR
jgi:D-glycero-D-manno-heptose 1,7-bisphosphate phosphatase